MKKVKTISNLPIRLSVAERPILLGIAEHLGLEYKGRASIGQILHYLAAGEALILLHSFNTSGEMRATAERIRELLKSLDAETYERLEQSFNGLSVALDNAATIRSEFEQAEADETSDDYS